MTRIARLLRTFIPVLAIVFSFAFSSTTHAEDIPTGSGLQISPAIVEMNGDSGVSYIVTIKVKNVTSSSLSFSSAVNDFTAKNESGTPSILLDGSKTATSIQDWVAPIGSFSLTPQEEKVVEATLIIPQGAEPGGHYGVIRFTGEPTTDTPGQVGLAASAGTLVLVRVSGTVTQKLDLETFDVESDGKANNVFEKGPLSFVTRFKNTGSVHVKPVGQIEVKDMFGGHVATLAVNPTEGNVLPGSTRRFDIPLDNSWLIGKYTADISVAYGDQGGAIVQQVSFWVIPWKLILIGLLVLLTIGYILKSLISRYNTYIIEKSKRHEASTNKKKKH